MAKATNKQDRDLLAQLHERYKRATSADDENRRECQADIRFCYTPGEQWASNVRQERGDRPCLEFNKLRVTVKRVINDMRSQRPAGKVRPTEDADKDTAEAYEGLIRNIWANSDGDSVIDQAAEYQVAGGMGAWRVTTKYSRDDAWDQDLTVEAIPNPLCLYRDPASKDPCGSDADYWLLTERMSKATYEARWPKAEVVDFEADTSFDQEEWEDEESVRVCEYWYRVPVQETLLLLSDGRSVLQSQVTPEQAQQLTAQGIVPVKTRSVQRHQIKMIIASGSAILERADWAGSHFPFVVVYGDSLTIDGKLRWWGLVRHSKDAQRAYNYSRTLAVETIALAPQAKYWSTPVQAAGHEGTWAESHKRNYPVQFYNPDPLAPGAPQRMPGADIPAAWVNEIALSSEDIKGTSGIFDASLGARTNETSGIAIRQRQQEGSLATWNYSENLARGIRRTWQILVDLIPSVYDTQRSIRVLGVDGAEKYVTVNDGMTDLSRGKYDVTVTVGPSFSTQRQEAAEVYMGLAQANPAVMPVAGDLIFKSLDLPYADAIANRLKALLPPQIQQMESEGKEIPPEARAVMMQAQQAMQMAQQQSELVQQAAQEVQQDKADADKAKAEVQKAVSDFEVKKANFEAQLAKVIADISMRESRVTAEVQSTNASNAETQQNGDREALSDEVQQAVAEIRQLGAAMMQQAVQTMIEIQQAAPPQVVVANPLRRRQAITRRVNGQLITEVMDVPETQEMQ